MHAILLPISAITMGRSTSMEDIGPPVEGMRVNAMVLALIIAHVPAEHPERLGNSFLTRQGTFGSIAGAMVLQRCIPAPTGVAATRWAVDLADPVQAASILIALLSASITYLDSKRREIALAGLFFGGLLHAVFMALVLMTI